MEVFQGNGEYMYCRGPPCSVQVISLVCMDSAAAVLRPVAPLSDAKPKGDCIDKVKDLTLAAHD